MTKPKQQPKKPRRWRRWLIAIVLVLLAVGVGVWFFATGVARQTIEAQLGELGLGKPNIGGVSIGLNGITANDIEFFKDPNDSQAMMTIDSLNIVHPIAGLVAGDEVFNEIEIAGAMAMIDVAEPQSDEPFDLSSISLPAKSLKIIDSTVVLQQENRTDFTLGDINLAAKSDDETIDVQGTIGQVAGGELVINGSLNPKGKTWNAELVTESVILENGVWQNWPGLPDSLEQQIELDGTLAATVKLNGNEETPLSYHAEVAASKTKLRIPSVDLPVDVQSMNLVARDGVVQYENIVASTDGKDRLTGSGSTTIAGFPLATQFNFDFADLDVATLRKFAEDIPAEVVGRATGKAKGTVDVESSMRITIALDANGRSGSGSYGQIQPDDLTISVAIRPLVFDSEFELETIEGSVVVEATASDLPTRDIFESLDLVDLNKQIGIEATVAGDFRLELPLATADKLETWKMNVAGTAPQGTISGQPVHNISVKANMDAGNLSFSEITAEADPESKSLLNLTVDWPLTPNANHPQFGKLNVAVSEVSPQWLIDFVEEQIKNSSGDQASDAEADLTQGLGELAGAVNFSSQIAIPVETPDLIDQWNVTGTVSDSMVAVEGYQLRDLNSTFSLAEGVFAVEEVGGLFDGGTLQGNGRFNVTTGEIEAANVVGDSVPLKWLASVGSEFSPDLKKVLTDGGFLDSGEAEPLEGALSIGFQLKDTNELGIQNDVAGESDDRAWVISTRVSSNELNIKGERLRNLLIEGEFDAREIKVQNARVDMPDQGKLDLSGNWLIDEGSGQADADWQRIPISWLASFSGTDLEMLAGTTSGKIRLSKTDVPPAEGALPISVTGSVNAAGVALGGFKTRELGFDIRTDGDTLLFENFSADESLRGIDLNGNLKLAEPFNFAINGVVDSLPVSRIFALPSVTEEAGETKEVSGIANAKIEFGGDLTTLEWQTSGNVAITAPRVDGQRLRDIEANWTHSGNDWAGSKAVINAFGGTIELKELVAAPARISVEIADIKASELTSLAALPVELTGTLSGDASLNEWSLAETRWAELNLTGVSAVVGSAEFGDVSAKAELRKQKLTYSLGGRLLNGKLTSEGEADLSTISETGLQDLSFPLEVQLTNGSLNDLYRRSPSLTSLRPLLGTVSANAEVVVRLDSAPTGQGTIRVNDLTWNNELLTREVSTVASLTNDSLQFDNLRVDLKQGEVSGRATLPLAANATGSYQIDVRQFDLQRFIEIVVSDAPSGVGTLDARISGQIGRSVSGQGSLAINRSEVLGLSGRTFRVPVRFQIEPQQQSGRVEFRQSRFQLFGGNVSGRAALEFGRSLNFSTDLRVSRLDTEKLFSTVAGFDDSGQGDLSGRFILRGTAIRSLRDLQGSFTGELDRAQAFQLPLLDTLTTPLGGNQLQTREFDSDEIDLRLNAGKIEVRQLNLSNSLAKVAISGNVFVDGRLDLDVSGRVERFNQPTLIDQFAGSPLSRVGGPTVAVLAEAAEFLSDRLIFLKVGGTISRPQVRPDSGRLLQQETIRYFLRGSQIFPNTEIQNN